MIKVNNIKGKKLVKFLMAFFGLVFVSIIAKILIRKIKSTIVLLGRKNIAVAYKRNNKNLRISLIVPFSFQSRYKF